MLVPALAGVLGLGCQSGGDGGPPTAEEAHRFVEAAESRLKTLGDNASRSGWVQSNFITVDTQEIAANAQSELAAAVSELARGARRFEQLQLPYDDARKLKVLKLLLAAPAPDNKAERDELSSLSSSLEGDYGKGKYCRDVKGKQECLDINSASNILSSSRDPKELLDVWQGWHAVGAPMRDRYSRFVELSNKGARELGFADAGVLWRSFYDMPPDAFAAEVDRLWTQVQPLYLALHTYVRSKLAEKYGAGVLPANGMLPAHLLGNMWAQDWSNIYQLVAAPASGQGYDLTKELKRRKVDARGMVKYAEGFFTSLGYQPLPPAFWERSLLHQARRPRCGLPRERIGMGRARGRSHQDVHRDQRRRFPGGAPRARPQLLRAAVCKTAVPLSRRGDRRVPRSSRRSDRALGDARIPEADRSHRSGADRRKPTSNTCSTPRSARSPSCPSAW